MDLSTGGLSARLAEYSRLADDVLALRDGIDNVRATAYSPDGLIAATVGGRGELIDLELDPRIYRETDVAALAATIAATIRDAAVDATRDAARIVESLMPIPADEDADPLFDPILHVLDTEPGRSQRLWQR